MTIAPQRLVLRYLAVVTIGVWQSWSLVVVIPKRGWAAWCTVEILSPFYRCCKFFFTKVRRGAPYLFFIKIKIIFTMYNGPRPKEWKSWTNHYCLLHIKFSTKILVDGFALRATNKNSSLKHCLHLAKDSFLPSKIMLFLWHQQWALL